VLRRGAARVASVEAPQASAARAAAAVGAEWLTESLRDRTATVTDEDEETPSLREATAAVVAAASSMATYQPPTFHCTAHVHRSRHADLAAEVGGARPAEHGARVDLQTTTVTFLPCLRVENVLPVPIDFAVRDQQRARDAQARDTNAACRAVDAALRTYGGPSVVWDAHGHRAVRDVTSDPRLGLWRDVCASPAGEGAATGAVVAYGHLAPDGVHDVLLHRRAVNAAVADRAKRLTLGIEAAAAPSTSAAGAQGAAASTEAAPSCSCTRGTT